ncbi:MAG: ABC transporter permease [Blautia sp.]|nr:ABC transporter permease [Blautia sp.]MDY3997658.1 ABC transporter permease [Blautia sp.]
MRKVKNQKCLSNISRKSMLANKKRNIILLIAIVLTTVMLTTLFTVGSSIMKSMEISTTYQVGTSYHAGFKFLTQEEYDELATDTHIIDLSYNVIAGVTESEELKEDYTEIRYTEAESAKNSYSYPSQGKLPEKYHEVATCTTVLDAFGLPHELGQTIHLKMSNGFTTYEGDFYVCGIWEKPASTVANQIYVSKAFQEEFSPTWKNREDYDRFIQAGSYCGSINPGFNFKTSFNISGQMDQLKERHGFGPEINDGIKWAYAASELDFTSVMIVVIILFMIILSGYLIIHNIFLIAVTSDIHYYGLLKTIGTTNRQLKKIVLKQALSLSLIAIPIGLVLGFVTSYFVFPFIVVNLAIQKCEIIPNIWVFVICALFSWFTVRISCEKPFRFIRKISPVEAVRYNDATVGKLSKKRKSKKVTTLSMAWENLKRNKRRTVAVLLSMALSIVMINVTVSIVACMDKEKYISNFSSADFTIADAAIMNFTSLEIVCDGVRFEDIQALESNLEVEESGAIYMSESLQHLEGTPYERFVALYEEHPDWFIYDMSQKESYDQLVYENKSINSRIYGVDRIAFDKMEMDTKVIDYETFCSGDYAIVSSPVEGGGDDSKYAYYHVGDKITVDFPDGSSKEYEVIGIGDVSYSMGPGHSHGMDIYITIPSKEYREVIPDTKGALKYFINVKEDHIDTAEEYISDYCENISSGLDYTSRETYLKDFNETIRTFLVIGGALSAILALIAILNMINLTYTSIHERKQELSVLGAIGMTKKQIAAMLSYEGIFRVLLTFALVITIGQLLNYAIVHLMAGSMIMFSYRYVVWPMLVCIPVFLIIVALIPRIIWRNHVS